MNPDAVRELLKRQPFEPFEVRMSNGDRHEVRHPEFVIVTAGRMVVADPVSDRLSILSLTNVVELRIAQPAGGTSA